MSSGCSVDSGGWHDQCGQNCVHNGNFERSKFHRMVLLKKFIFKISRLQKSHTIPI